MKWLQALLFIIGNAITSMMIVGVGLGVISDLTLFSSNRNDNGISNWGSAYGIIFAFLFGALIGILMGVIHSIIVIVRSEGLLWHQPTWLGILAGLAVARPAIAWYPVLITACFGSGSAFHDLTEYVVGMMIFTVMLATCGGYAGWTFEVVKFSGRR